jgi:hypothetical protein
MKLTNKDLKEIINEELKAVLNEYEYGKFSNKPGEYRNPWTGEELTPEQQARLDQPLDLALDKPAWFLDLKMRYKNDNRTPEEVARDEADFARQEREYAPEDHDATTPMPTPAFSTTPVGPDGEVAIQGIPMMADEDDDMGLYPR